MVRGTYWVTLDGPKRAALGDRVPVIWGQSHAKIHRDTDARSCIPLAGCKASPQNKPRESVCACMAPKS